MLLLLLLLLAPAGAGAMRLITKEISKEGGRVKLVPQDAEDLWTVYNLVSVGDSLRADTLRKVSSETSTGTVSSERLRITLTIQVCRLKCSRGRVEG